jgi:CTP synthase
VHGILVPGGFGERGFEGKIAAIRHARKQKIPFFGICYGMQAAVVEFARSDCGITDATTTEYDPNAKNPVIALMEDQKRTNEKGGTMRLGAFECALETGTRSHRAYQATTIHERHRHRFELNNAYRERLAQKGLVMAGRNPKLDLVEVVELPDHPWFVGVQYHPEFKTKPLQPHPLFRDFVQAAVERASSPK